MVSHADHLDELAPATDQFGKSLRRLARQRPQLGAHRLGEMRDRRGVGPVRLGEPSGSTASGRPAAASPAAAGISMPSVATTITGARRPSRAATFRDAAAIPAHGKHVPRRPDMHVEAAGRAQRLFENC
jgi:hypothetical protein